MAEVTTENQQHKIEPINYIAEIRQMMHGFGDHPEPLVETAKIIESVVLNQMRGIVYKACEVADMRQNQIVTAEDFLFLLRKDKIKLQRFVNYLKFKDYRAKLIVESEILDVKDFDKEATKLSYIKFLRKIDNTGELLNDKELIDFVKQSRNMRADLISRTIDEARYLEFTKARSATFANKNKHKFSDWIGACGDFTISKTGYTAMGYLAYETVAQIVDLAFLVRQDQNKLDGDPIDRLQSSYHNPITYKPYHSKSLMTKPLTPSEVNEALRRFWSPQFEMTGPYNRWSSGNPHVKFLAL